MPRELLRSQHGRRPD